MIVLPDSPIETATKILERLREQLVLALTNGRVPAFTVSFGLASSTDADTFDEIIASADDALLQAKAGGRNRTVRATDFTGPTDSASSVLSIVPVPLIPDGVSTP